MRKSSKWFYGVGFSIAGVFGAAALLTWADGIIYNVTPSMPRGLYVERSLTEPLQRGEIIAICVTPDPRVTYYVGSGRCNGLPLEPLLKPVAAIAGDTVEVTEAGVVVNGRLLAHSARIPKDGNGRSMVTLFPPVEGAQTVAPGTVWVIAPVDYSFDSRYFGPLETTAVVSIAEPLLTE